MGLGLGVGMGLGLGLGMGLGLGLGLECEEGPREGLSQLHARRLQPYVMEAATVCDEGGNRM